MKKAALGIILFLSICYSCKEDEKTVVPVEATEQVEDIGVTPTTDIKEDTVKNPGYSYHDTTLVGTVHYQVDFMEWVRDEKALSNCDDIWRQGDTLFFKTRDSLVILVNEEYDEELQNFEAPAYQFARFDEKQNIAEVQVHCYEYWYHVLVDMTTGDTLRTLGSPLFTDNGELILTSNVDLETQFTENGFQLFKRTPNGFEHLNTTLLYTWGIAKASWLDEHRLLILKATIDENYDIYFNPGVLTLNIVDEQ